MPIGFRNLETGLYKCYSSAGFGSLGAVPDGYEEVYLPGPPSQEQVEHIISLAQSLDAMFMTLPVEVRAQFYGAKSRVKLAIESNDVEAARLIIQSLEAPSGLEAVKTAMLAMLPEVS